MASDEPASVTRLVDLLKQGDKEATSQLWEKFFDRLVTVARRRLGSAPRRDADEEDVVVSVFDSLCRGAARGNFSQLTDREDLWKLLLVITRQKAVDQIRRNTRQKRGGGNVRGESVFQAGSPDDALAGIDRMPADAATPELLVAADEQFHRLLNLLGDESLKQVAVWRMEGFKNDEIADRLGLTTRSVERKLRLIRELWLEQSQDE